MNQAFHATEADRIRRLSPRERQIAEAIWSETPDKGIVQALGIAQGTVRIYVARLLRKLQVSTRVGIARQWERWRHASRNADRRTGARRGSVSPKKMNDVKSSEEEKRLVRVKLKYDALAGPGSSELLIAAVVSKRLAQYDRLRERIEGLLPPGAAAKAGRIKVDGLGLKFQIRMIESAIGNFEASPAARRPATPAPPASSPQARPIAPAVTVLDEFLALQRQGKIEESHKFFSRHKAEILRIERERNRSLTRDDLIKRL